MPGTGTSYSSFPQPGASISPPAAPLANVAASKIETVLNNVFTCIFFNYTGKIQQTRARTGPAWHGFTAVTMVERARGIEPPLPAWEAGVITTIRRPPVCPAGSMKKSWLPILQGGNSTSGRFLCASGCPLTHRCVKFVRDSSLRDSSACR